MTPSSTPSSIDVPSLIKTASIAAEGTQYGGIEYGELPVLFLRYRTVLPNISTVGGGG
jgi:hypothetical protein